jgi:hypothetical protein
MVIGDNCWMNWLILVVMIFWCVYNFIMSYVQEWKIEG